ncbi:SRPBCC family protein [Epibacterium sp. Ofav1-8]|uniref:SRPBCC family protein n=1 Tax=Epibacterium sp. Ofav1-8 TaxID=2917735 RepID=UPI001EF695B1|nr:SRPBCC family protein [Epibacterium sp. Ofav1-8]MCG7625126.1 SRPBCC family protein [Epibacterium sp. Ofav1-8]
MKLNPKTDLSFTRTLNAPRSVLWECWTTPKHIKNFFMPTPHSLDSCEIDLRVGGKFNTVMNVDGKQIENKGVYLEVVDGERLVFTDTYSEGWAPAADPFMTAIVEFKDDENGGTIYTATARHRSPEARQTHEDMGFFDGWGTVATQLEEYAQSLAKH